ncbi:DNA topoisomerase 3 [Scandinavium goeteborgense]|uniref:DNA topoisomerase 3 n=1 Tax=Scandinavium goeteborgense TaxID=1851514 RepID=UPI00380D6545
MRVFIAEKPSLARAIFEGLGGNPETEKHNGYFQHNEDVVTWCFGHMLELYEPQDYDERYKVWRLDDLPIVTKTRPTLKSKPESKAQLGVITTLIKKATSIVHAGDPDEEGCLLVDEILGHVGNTAPVLRLLVADLNLAPVQKALASMQPNENFRGMTNSAFARSLADQSFGFNLTRGCTLKGREKGYDGVLSVGRVQSAVLGLVNDRTLANQSHTPSFYYDIYASLDIKGLPVKARYLTTDTDQVDEKKRLISEAQAKHIAERVSGQDVRVTLAITKPAHTPPPLPLNLSTLQVLCARRFGYQAKETLDIMQGLYETHKLLTYPRSDNRYLSDEHFFQAGDIAGAISKTMPELFQATSGMDRSHKHKAFDASKMEAHHAIVPTTKSGEGIRLSAKEQNVYRLVAEHYIALFYPDAIRDKTKIHFDIKGDTFTATQSKLVQKGWEALGTDTQSDEDAAGDDDNADSSGSDLAALKSNESGQCLSSNVDQKKTTPPKYFTESSLLSAMTSAARFIDDPDLRKLLEAKDEGGSDKGSIGTEATRASILEKLAANTGLISIEKEKGYSEKVWKTTKQGQEFCAALPKEVTKPDISARWAGMQAQIKAGELTVEAFIADVDSYIAERLNDLATNGINITSTATPCPVCQKGFLRKRKGSNGYFWGCTNYPDCKTTFPDKGGKPSMEKKAAPTVSEHACPDCGKGMIRRAGKPFKGKPSFFWGCSGYPVCKTTLFDKAGKPDFDSKK